MSSPSHFTLSFIYDHCGFSKTFIWDVIPPNLYCVSWRLFFFFKTKKTWEIMACPNTERYGIAVYLNCKITELIGTLKRRQQERWNASISCTFENIHHCSSKQYEEEDSSFKKDSRDFKNTSAPGEWARKCHWKVIFSVFVDGEIKWSSHILHSRTLSWIFS